MTRDARFAIGGTQPATPPLRILAYSHDSCGLGHVRRVTNVAWGIHAASPESVILFVTGSTRPDLFPLPPGADYLRLPSIGKDERGTYRSRSLQVPIEDTVSVRAEVLRAAARSFRPDAILVDHTPAGIHGELLPMLEEQRERADPPFTVLGLRDVLDAPERARVQLRRPHVRRALTLYDRILVYGHQHLCDVGTEYGMDPMTVARLRYVGVAADRAHQRPQSPTLSGGRPANLLVTVGGGEDGEELLVSALSLLRRNPAGRYRATVVTGPMLQEHARRRVMALAHGVPDVRLITATDRFDELVKEADLVLSMAGYNTVYEALSLGRRLLVAPRTAPRMEQMERALRLERLDLLGVLTPAELSSPMALQRRVELALRSAAPDARRAGISFHGATAAAGEILAGGAAPVYERSAMGSYCEIGA